MWIVFPHERGGYGAMEFRDDASIEQIESIMRGNWFGSTKKTRQEAIQEAKASGLKYVSPEKMDALRNHASELQSLCSQVVGRGYATQNDCIRTPIPKSAEGDFYFSVTEDADDNSEGESLAELT